MRGKLSSMISPSTPADAPSPKTRRTVAGGVLLGLAVSVVFVVLFVRLFDFVTDTGHNVLPFDRSLLLWMYHRRTPPLNELGEWLANLGSPPVIVGIGLVGALAGTVWRKVRGAAWTLPIAILGSGLIIQTVKLIVQRPRPAAVPHGFQPLLPETGYSFPSGHSLIAMTVYGLLGYFALGVCRHRWARLTVRVLTALLVLAIGASRVYVGVHYPTDVLAGWTAGVPWLVTCLGLHELLTRRWPRSGEPVLTPQAGRSGDAPSAGAVAKTVLEG